MALSLNGSSYLSGAFSAITAYPFTIYCSAQTSSTAVDGCAFEMGSAGADDDAHALFFRGDVAGDPVQFRRTGPSGAGIGINSVASYTANTWTDICGVAASATDGRLYANNVKSTNATSIGFANGNIVIGGHLALNNPSSRLTGLVARCAIWDVALTDDDVASLSKGFSPRRLRPQALKFYAPLVRNFIDIKGGVLLTSNGSPAMGAHPRTYGF